MKCVATQKMNRAMNECCPPEQQMAYDPYKFSLLFSPQSTGNENKYDISIHYLQILNLIKIYVFVT
jgi:hypothetical protein